MDKERVTIGYYAIDTDDTEMFCLLCSQNDWGKTIDPDNPVTTDGYPDGFICADCWGCVNPDGTVTKQTTKKEKGTE
jgi:hypothetical protein